MKHAESFFFCLSNKKYTEKNIYNIFLRREAFWQFIRFYFSFVWVTSGIHFISLATTISQHLFESNLSNYYYLDPKYYFHLLPISAKREDKVLLKC